MRRLAVLSLATTAVAIAACSDVTPPPLSPSRPSLAVAADRVGTEKPLPGDVIAAATVSVAPLAPGGATALAQSLAGTGVTIQNVSYIGVTGANASAGAFTNGATPVGFDAGVMLSSGRVIDVLGPNSSKGTSFDLGTGGDAQLSSLAGYPTYNATVLSFEIVPDADSVFFQYVFSSEEYNEYVFSQFNDVFAFYVNGVNCAVVGTPPVPVTVNRINNGHELSFGVNPQNPGLFRNNTAPQASTIDLEPDGLTTVLTCRAGVNKNVANTVRLAIADASDPILDSWVFIKEGSFSTNPPENTPPTLAAIDAQTVDEGSPLTFTAMGSDADVGQTLTYSLVGAPAGATIDPTTGVFSWTPTDDDPTGTPSDAVTVIVRVEDSFSPAASAEQTVQITVNNVAPAITQLTVPLSPTALGTAVPVTMTFTDVGSGDTHVAAVTSWGDATAATPAAVTETNGSGAASASHVYAAPGVYSITVRVADDDGGSAHLTATQYVVVYDPNGGFVTGGGWILSPAGAYTADPSLAGRANFGFVSKYQKGASVPDGETEFQFHAGSLNFHSTAYDWLVIAGPKAQYKGIGTINGAGDYGFLLTANDGQVSGGGGQDRFRIKIWDKSTGAIVYDNQAGGADGDPATTAIGGGSIVIHK